MAEPTAEYKTMQGHEEKATYRASQFDTSEVVRLKPDYPRSIFVHKSLLLAASGTLSDEMSRDDDGGDSSEILCCNLRGFDFAIVDAYVHWLYHGELAQPLYSMTRHGHDLAEAYNFGTGYGDVDYMDAVIDQIILRIAHECWTGPELLFFHTICNYFNDCRSTSASLNQLMVDLYLCLERRNQWYLTENHSYLKGNLLRNSLLELDKVVAGGEITDPFAADRCTYHEHTKKGLPCYQDKQKTESVPS